MSPIQHQQLKQLLDLTEESTPIIHPHMHSTPQSPFQPYIFFPREGTQ